MPFERREITLNYGMKENLLAKNIGCTVAEAKSLVAKYMARYPAVSKFYKEAIDESRDTGCAFTILGRRRFLPEINSYDSMTKWRAERQAVNHQIQGTAADVVRMAMINVDKADLEKKYGCKMTLQIHDELLFECPEESAQQAHKEISELMSHPFRTDLVVPLTIAGHVVTNWADAK